MKNTKVRNVKVVQELLISATILQKQGIDANIQVEMARRSLMSSSTVGERANNREFEKLDSVAVENLVYSGKQPIFQSKEFFEI